MRNTLIVGGACEGKTKYVKEVLNYSDEHIIFPDRDLFIDAIKARLSIDDLFFKLTCEQEGWCIIINQVGSGIVPIDREERMFREYVGSFSCLVADKADYVYRVVCGLAQEIKGK